MAVTTAAGATPGAETCCQTMPPSWVDHSRVGLTASIQPSIGSAKRTDTGLVPYAVEMVARGAGAVVQVCPPLVVRAIARHMPDALDAPDPHGTWPATHPSRADTKVTASGWNDAGTGVLGAGPRVVAVAPGRRGTTTMAGTEVAGAGVEA